MDLNVFQYYYPINLIWDSSIYIIQLIKFYNYYVWFVIFQQVVLELLLLNLLGFN